MPPDSTKVIKRFNQKNLNLMVFIQKISCLK